MVIWANILAYVDVALGKVNLNPKPSLRSLIEYSHESQPI